jgi:hypothetical protein
MFEDNLKVQCETLPYNYYPQTEQYLQPDHNKDTKESTFIGTSDDLLHLRPGRRVHVFLSNVGGCQGSSEMTWLKCAGQSPLSFALARIEELSGRDTPLTSYLFQYSIH